MRDRTRVVITGMGCITPIGSNLELYRTSLENGVSGAGLLTRFDTSDLKVKIGCEVKDFNPKDYIDKKLVSRTDLFSQYAAAAVRDAILDAGLPLTEEGKMAPPYDGQNVMIILGTGVGGVRTVEEQTGVLINKGSHGVEPLTIPKLMPNAAAAIPSLEFTIHGATSTINTACSSSNDAIANAYDKLLLGRADVVITGGAEACITRLAISAFSNLKALTQDYNDYPTRASRPFDKERSGFVIGEGAGIIVLETLEHAISRGARIYAEIIGYGATSDAYHLTAPHETGAFAINAMVMALDMAGIKPEQVDYINAHGTSTPHNDKMETAAIRSVFGSHADRLYISSTKSMTGHLLGAAGGVEMIATVLGMRHDTIYPTINYTTQDPECDLNYVPNKSINIAHNIALLNSFGFGGHNNSLLIRKME